MTRQQQRSLERLEEALGMVLKCPREATTNNDVAGFLLLGTLRFNIIEAAIDDVCEAWPEAFEIAHATITPKATI